MQAPVLALHTLSLIHEGAILQTLGGGLDDAKVIKVSQRVNVKSRPNFHPFLRQRRMRLDSAATASERDSSRTRSTLPRFKQSSVQGFSRVYSSSIKRPLPISLTHTVMPCKMHAAPVTF